MGEVCELEFSSIVNTGKEFIENINGEDWTTWRVDINKCFKQQTLPKFRSKYKINVALSYNKNKGGILYLEYDGYEDEAKRKYVPNISCLAFNIEITREDYFSIKAKVIACRNTTTKKQIITAINLLDQPSRKDIIKITFNNNEWQYSLDGSPRFENIRLFFDPTIDKFTDSCSLDEYDYEKVFDRFFKNNDEENKIILNATNLANYIPSNSK